MFATCNPLSSHLRPEWRSHPAHGTAHPAGTVHYRGGVANKTSKRPASVPTTDGINPRQPCPCGSGRRYKACHGSGDAENLIVARPFAGLAAETELIALREFVPSATAPFFLQQGDAPKITLGTVLPAAAAALTRADGSILLGLQVQTHSGDLSRDLGAALEWALQAGPSSVLSVVGPATAGNRLQDLIVDDDLDVTVHDTFQWWLEEAAEPGSEVALTLERANAAILPTAKIAGLPGAYWVDAGAKAHLRWVRREEESTLMAGLARLAATGELDLGDGSRYVGSFRAHGRLVPVWDLDRDAHPSEWAAPTLAFEERLQRALAVDEPLNVAERRARDGILGRQFTLR